METKLIDINTLNNAFDETSVKLHSLSMTDIFGTRSRSYINEFKLFMVHFNAIPNWTEEIDVDCKKANLWFKQHYASIIKDCHYSKIYFSKNKKAEFDDIFYLLYDDLIVDFDTNNSEVRFLYKKTSISLVEDLMLKIKKFKKRKRKDTPTISLLVSGPNGITCKYLQLKRQKLNIDDNYNEDFIATHHLILKRLRKKNDKGLVLLHGKPGTGKTSYIRYLASHVNKNVIFLPPNMAGAITNPDLMSLLIDNPNSIFVIEDAENIIFDRERDGNSPVSALLNISDGLLSDCLNIQIICSFNTDINKVDRALMRKGRLIAKYEFKALTVEKANALSTKLGFKTEIKEPMTLTAIYNQDQQEFQQTARSNPIGFRS